MLDFQGTQKIEISKMEVNMSDWNMKPNLDTEKRTYTVYEIAAIPTPDQNNVEAQYAVYITVEDASSFYYGMNVIVTTGGNN